MKLKKTVAFIMSLAITLSFTAAGISGTVNGEETDSSPFEARVHQSYMYSSGNEPLYELEIESINESTNTLIIPSEYDGIKASVLGYFRNDNIHNIVFPSDYTAIGSLLCPNLEYVVLPDDIKITDFLSLGKDVVIIGNEHGFASYYAEANGNKFVQSGDLNDDGKVSATDIVKMISYYTGRFDATAFIKLVSDLDRDGKMSIADLIRLKSLIIEGSDNGGSDISGCLAEPDLFGFTRSYNTETDSSLSRFTADVTSGILLNTKDENGEVNTVYSPLSLYMALSVLTECSDTKTLDELLEFLHADSKEDLRKINAGLFESMYLDKYNRYNRMANSIWLDDGYNFNQDTIERLAEYYYTSVYEKDLQRQEDLDDISEWVYRNTSGKLRPQLQPSPFEAVKILNAVTFKEKWTDKFGVEKEEEFTLPDGTVKKCMMMSDPYDVGLITENEKYTRYSRTFEDGYRMNFVLPAEGCSTDDLLSDSELLNEMFSKNQKEERCYVNVKVPSYNIASKFDLTQTIQDMGISHIFEDADFSTLSEDKGMYVSGIAQEAVLTLDSEGCEAAAYTMIVESASSVAPTYRKVDFTADRPFIYYISDSVNTPLFVGVINDPTEK